MVSTLLDATSVEQEIIEFFVPSKRSAEDEDEDDEDADEEDVFHQRVFDMQVTTFLIYRFRTTAIYCSSVNT